MTNYSFNLTWACFNVLSRYNKPEVFYGSSEKLGLFQRHAYFSIEKFFQNFVNIIHMAPLRVGGYNDVINIDVETPSISSHKMSSIARWKIIGAIFNLTGKRQNSYLPLFTLKAVFPRHTQLS